MNKPDFTLQDVKYSVDGRIFARAEELFKNDAVSDISETVRGYDATVYGGSPYHVSISKKRIDRAYCNCYMGENDELCKHVIALGLAVLHASGKMEETPEESPTDLAEAKLLVSAGMRKLKAYDGPSRIWFAYQNNLDIGCGIIEAAVQNLPPNKENAKYIWKLVLKLSDKMIYGGIDDSNGTVGNCATALATQCAKYANQKPELKPFILKFANDDTDFGFESDLKDGID